MEKNKAYITESMCFVQQKIFMEKIEEVKNKVNNIEVALASLPEKLIEKLDERYADKEVVDDMKDSQKWLIRLVLGAILLAIMDVILKN